MENEMKVFEGKVQEKIQSFTGHLAETKEELSGLIEQENNLCEDYLDPDIDPLELKESDIDELQSVTKAIKETYKDIEDTRKSITSPLDDCKKLVMDYIRGAKDNAQKAKKNIKKIVLAWNDEQDRIRREEESRIQAKIEAERKKAELAQEMEDDEAVEQQALKVERMEEAAKEKSEEKPDIDRRTFRKNWRAKVMDEKKIPREYLEPNMTKLNKAARDSKGKANIPGVVFVAR